MSGWKEVKASMRAWFDQHIVSPIVAEAESQVIERAREETQRRLDEERQRQEAARQADLRRIESLSDEMRGLEQRTARRLEEHDRQTAQRLSELSGALRSELLAAVADSGQALRTELAEERRQRMAEAERLAATVEGLADTVGGLADTARRAEEEARQWLRDAMTERARVADLPHEKFARGRLIALDQRLAAVGADIDKGFAQAALGPARDVAAELSELRLDVELRRQDWTRLQTAAIERLAVLDGSIQANARAFVLDRSGEKLAEVQFDVDRWSDGGLARLREKVAAVVTRVDGGEPDLDELRRIVADEVPELEGELASVVAEAQQRVVASQLRANIADLVTEVLEDRFAYQTQRWEYRGGDEAQAVVALLELGGNEIVVEVAPGQDYADNQVRLYSLDATTASRERRNDRMAEVARELSERGVDLGGVQERPEPDRAAVLALLDAAAVRERAPAPGVRGPAGTGG